MTGMTQAEAIATLDARFPTSGGGDYVGYSANGTTETASLARTAIGATGWAGATAAQPSIKANANILTTPQASGIVTVGYTAIFSASTSGTQRTDWQAMAASKALAVGDMMQHAVGAIAVTLD